MSVHLDKICFTYNNFLDTFLSWFYILYKACVIIAYTLYSLFLCSKITKLETLSIFVKAYQPLLSHLQARENIHQVAFAKECWSKISKKYHWVGESVELIWLNFLNKSGIVCHWRKTNDWLSFIFLAFLCLSWKHTQESLDRIPAKSSYLVEGQSNCLLKNGL